MAWMSRPASGSVAGAPAAIRSARSAASSSSRSGNGIGKSALCTVHCFSYLLVAVEYAHAYAPRESTRSTTTVQPIHFKNRFIRPPSALRLHRHDREIDVRSRARLMIDALRGLHVVA